MVIAGYFFQTEISTKYTLKKSSYFEASHTPLEIHTKFTQPQTLNAKGFGQKVHQEEEGMQEDERQECGSFSEVDG